MFVMVPKTHKWENKNKTPMQEESKISRSDILN